MSNIVKILFLLCLLLVVGSSFRVRFGHHGRDRSRHFGFHHGQDARHGGIRRHGERRFGFGLDTDHFGFNIQFGSENAQWWLGPNTCTHRSENNDTDASDERNITQGFFSTDNSCHMSDTVYRCTERILSWRGNFQREESIECCHGYYRHPSDYGCPRVIRDLKNLTSTARDLGLTGFIASLQAVNLLGQLDSSNLTVFAPNNSAFDEIAEALPPMVGLDLSGAVLQLSDSVSSQLSNEMTSLMMAHLAFDLFPTFRLQDEQTIATSQGDSSIRINIYQTDGQITTANCKRIISSDNMASNGIIHVVDGVLPMATETMLDIVSGHQDLSFMKTAIGRSGLSSLLRGEGQMTLFAPSNTAFLNMNQNLRERLLNDGRTLENLVKNHLLPNVICATVLQGRMRSVNFLQKQVHFRRSSDDKLFINDAQIFERDTMATNGVLYIIDDILIPNEALTVIELAAKMNVTTAVNLLERTGLTEELNQMENITFFVPTDAALTEFDTSSFDEEELRNILRYHVAPTDVVTCSRSTTSQLDSLVPSKQIRISQCPRSLGWNGEQTRVTAQCAVMAESSSMAASNGKIFLMSTMMSPPVGNVMDVLELDSQFSMFVRLLKTTDLADRLQENDLFTVLAPTNQALESNFGDYLALSEDGNGRLRQFLANHILERPVCCSELRESSSSHYPRIRTASRRRLRIRQNNNDQILVNDARILQCDLSASNGVVHAIDDVINTSRFGDFSWLDHLQDLWN